MGTGAHGSAATLETRPLGFETCAVLPDGSRHACGQLARKDLLIRELGHRVRNSLTVIASLACVEAQAIKDLEAAQSLERLKNRVAATALLYERLELGAGEASLRVDHYLAEVAGLVVESLALGHGRVEVSMDLAPLRLGPAAAGALGLIVNEAVTNAFKYGIIAGGGRRIHVALGTHGRGWRRLAIEDDGPGFPDGFDPSSDGDFGLELMIAEAESLGGNLRASNGGPGARIEVLFPTGGVRACLR